MKVLNCYSNILNNELCQQSGSCHNKIKKTCYGLLHEAGFCGYPGKFEFSLSKLSFISLKKVDCFLLVFITLVTHATWLLWRKFDSVLEIAKQNSICFE